MCFFVFPIVSLNWRLGTFCPILAFAIFCSSSLASTETHTCTYSVNGVFALNHLTCCKSAPNIHINKYFVLSHKRTCICTQSRSLTHSLTQSLYVSHVTYTHPHASIHLQRTQFRALALDRENASTEMCKNTLTLPQQKS